MTARDLGLDRMVAEGKDCIGKALGQRRVLQSNSRPTLVGLKPVGAVKNIMSGSHVFAPGKPTVPANDQGHVSSVCFSPTLGHMIALAFVANGQSRVGEQVRAVDLLRDFDTLCEITALPFYDPEGEKARG